MSQFVFFFFIYAVILCDKSKKKLKIWLWIKLNRKCSICCRFWSINVIKSFLLLLLTILIEIKNNGFISSGIFWKPNFNINLQSRSCNLTSINFCLCSFFFKSKIYANKPQLIKNVKKKLRLSYRQNYTLIIWPCYRKFY